MRYLTLRTLMAVAIAVLAGAGVASAADLSLRQVLRSGDAVDACRTNDRLTATFRFVKGQVASPDKCVVYRFVAHDDVQRACFTAIAAAAGQDSLSLSSLGIGGGTPGFCNEGCACSDTISYRQVE